MAVAPGHPPSLRFGGQSAHLVAIEILHRDIPIAIGILAKVPDLDSYRDCPVLRQVTPTNFIAGPLCVMRHKFPRQFGGLTINTYLCR